MSPQRKSALLGCVLSGCLAGCGSGDPPPPPASDANFRGTYAPTSAGDIEGITFQDQTYALMLQGCASASCVDVGRYSVDEDRTTLSLTSSKTGATRTLELRVLATKASGTQNTGVLPQTALIAQPYGVLPPPGGSPGGLLGSPSTVLGGPTPIILSQGTLLPGTVTSANLNNQGLGLADTLTGLLGQVAGAAAAASTQSAAASNDTTNQAPYPSPTQTVDCTQPLDPTITDGAYVYAYIKTCGQANCAAADKVTGNPSFSAAEYVACHEETPQVASN